MPEKMTVDPVVETPHENESKRTALSQPGAAPGVPAKASIFASAKGRLVLVILVLLVIAGAIYYVTEVTGYETTDDAQVDGHLMSLSARVGGYVQKVNVDDNQAVTQGATTIWERWDGWTPEKGFQNPGMNSFNHYSLGSCGEWMFDTVAGIGVDPNHPGVSHIIIDPRPGGDLTSAQSDFDSIHGKISTNWTLQNGSFSLHVVIPINTTATICLPTANASSVKESGRAISSHAEIKSIPDSQDSAQYLVGSGDYLFTCQVP